MSETPPFTPQANVHVVNIPDRRATLLDDLDDGIAAVLDDEDDCDTDTETDINGLKMKPLNHFRWLERDTSVKLNLLGSLSDSVDSLLACRSLPLQITFTILPKNQKIWTDWSPRIEIETVPSGRMFHHTSCPKREEKSGRLIPDQKLFYLLNSRNQRLLAIDYSNDLKSFHVMEPDSQRFIAFFTLPSFPTDENELPSPIYIHNVIDGEMYIVDPFTSDLSIPIKAESGEELAVIMRPPPKWTASQSGLMTLHFTGDDRDGLTCRERAIILGFFLSLGIQGINHWKRSSFGILTVYVLSAILGCFFVIFIYVAFRNDYTPLPLNLARLQYEDQQIAKAHQIRMMSMSTSTSVPFRPPPPPPPTTTIATPASNPVSLILSALLPTSPPDPE